MRKPKYEIYKGIPVNCWNVSEIMLLCVNCETGYSTLHFTDSDVMVFTANEIDKKNFSGKYRKPEDFFDTFKLVREVY